MINIFKKNYLRDANKELKKINGLSDKYKTMDKDTLRKQTEILKSELNKGKKLDDILPDAFALVRESCERTLGKRPYDVQMIGGIILHRGQIAEMKTGEGKANPLDLKIPTPDGWKTCGDIKVGDKLFDRFGQATEVIGVYPQGRKMQFDVHFADGRIAPAANSHLWTVYDKCDGFKKAITKTTKELMDMDELAPGRFFNYISEAVEYPEAELSKSPALLMYDFFETLRKNNELTSDKINRFTPEERVKNMEETLDKNYLISSIDQRWEMLNAITTLFQTENSKGNYSVEVPTNNEHVKEFILELCYSLGLAVKAEVEDNNTKFNIISNDEGVIDSKLIQITKIVKRNSIRTEMVCFEVDNEEHLFLVGDYVVTHNTIVSTAPIYLNALQGKVHVITVNDYLASRDEREIGKVLNFLGITSSCIYPKMPKPEKQKAYACDVIYGTNKEFGFDYLRDNMAKNKEDLLQTGLDFAIIDEVDSVLIDEARTPLIISGQGDVGSDIYKIADECVKRLEKGKTPPELTKIESAVNMMEGNNFTEEEIESMKDYLVYEQNNMVVLTDRGIKKVEKMLGIENLGDESNVQISHHIHQALIAYGTMKKDENYIVKNDKVQIVDDFTGRVLDGRRYSDGLHQAIEAKENVSIQEENKTLATISLQNYFRLYKKIAGMTGTAKTEEQEFKDIYKMHVVEVPTNLPVIREDKEDFIYITEKEKLEAVIRDIKEHHVTGQPILVGTPTIEQSEKVSKMLKKEGIPHKLLNAKHHELEAEIIAQAGIKNAVTIATNMAGRGTDIMLGGNPEHLAIAELKTSGLNDDEIDMATNFLPPSNEEEKILKNKYQDILKKQKSICAKNAEEVKALGGLHVVGTAKHESRRIDNQLRGRAGRQGDPGSSQFFLSLNDDVIRVFASGMLTESAKKLGLDYGEHINNKQLINTVENSQKRFETKNFDIRKSTLEYDDVDNTQRQIIYKKRSEVVNRTSNISDDMVEFLEVTAGSIVNNCFEITKETGIKGQEAEIINKGLCDTLNLEQNIVKQDMSKREMINTIMTKLCSEYNNKIKELKNTGYDVEYTQNQLALDIIDHHWIQYITAMQNLRDLTSLTGFGNTKPIDVYKSQSHKLFEDLMNRIKTDIVFAVLRIDITPQVQFEEFSVVVNF